MFRLVLITFVALRCADGLGDTLSRNQAIAFLSSRSGWRIYEANSLDVNPNLSIAPTSYAPNSNQRAVYVNFGGGQASVVALATVGAYANSQRNKHGYRTRGYDLDSIVITPVPIVSNNSTNQTSVTATPITLTFISSHSSSNQCMVARVNTGGTNNVDGVITNINAIAGDGTTCAVFVRNSTDTTLLDSREIRKCEMNLRKCSRSFRRYGRQHRNDVFSTTLAPSSSSTSN